MNKDLTKPKSWNLEQKALVAFFIIFLAVVLSPWIYVAKLRQSIAANNAAHNAVVNVDPSALIEIEHLRNMAENQMSDARSFFLLGSRTLFDMQKKERQGLTDALASFEKKYSLPQVPEILKRIEALEQQQQEIFDQGMEFREKQTESKIVGQFYQSKTSPLRAKLNESLDEIARLHQAELERIRVRAHEASADAEVQIPRGLAWFTGLTAFLFFGMALLVIRMIAARLRQTAERDRLYEEAKKAVQDRDEVISAVSQDLKDPLSEIIVAADSLKSSQEPAQVIDNAEFIKSAVIGIEGLIKDICDQKKSDMGVIALRLDQLGIDEILDDARLVLQPIAKQRDVRLQFDSVNPPVLAFFDRERVIRVLSNLVGNAIKFSPRHSRVVVKVRSDQKFVYISVTDSGPGIPESKLPEIFDHFWQARKTAAQGAGLGLALVKTIVEAQGGTVKAESKSGNGSTFTFSLPRRRPVGANLRRPTATVRHSSTQPHHSEFSEGPGH